MNENKFSLFLVNEDGSKSLLDKYASVLDAVKAMNEKDQSALYSIEMDTDIGSVIIL